MELLDCGLCMLKPWRKGDEARLAEIANDRNVSRYMTARFPYPYTLEDAKSWVAHSGEPAQPTNFAIVVAGEIAGGCGYEFGELEYSHSAEIGYWLGFDYWGKGIAAAALGVLTAHAFAVPNLRRLQATIYSPNLASARVAEKCGYVREAILHNAISKNAEIYDALIYAKVR
jgi:[ribosomal protein S5]-alanine N-acetyltransferase